VTGGARRATRPDAGCVIGGRSRFGGSASAGAATGADDDPGSMSEATGSRPDASDESERPVPEPSGLDAGSNVLPGASDTPRQAPAPAPAARARGRPPPSTRRRPYRHPTTHQSRPPVRRAAGSLHPIPPALPTPTVRRAGPATPSRIPEACRTRRATRTQTTAPGSTAAVCQARQAAPTWAVRRARRASPTWAVRQARQRARPISRARRVSPTWVVRRPGSRRGAARRTRQPTRPGPPWLSRLRFRTARSRARSLTRSPMARPAATRPATSAGCSMGQRHAHPRVGLPVYACDA
jgi:hypothetical protein